LAPTLRQVRFFVKFPVIQDNINISEMTGLCRFTERLSRIQSILAPLSHPERVGVNEGRETGRLWLARGRWVQ
jgi:hypothetical protein